MLALCALVGPIGCVFRSDRGSGYHFEHQSYFVVTLDQIDLECNVLVAEISLLNKVVFARLFSFFFFLWQSWKPVFQNRRF